MARGIPRVREWLATLADGRRFRILAPTRTLARLNLRGAGVYGALSKGPAPARREVGTRTMVAEDIPDGAVRWRYALQDSPDGEADTEFGYVYARTLRGASRAVAARVGADRLATCHAWEVCSPGYYENGTEAARAKSCAPSIPVDERG